MVKLHLNDIATHKELNEILQACKYNKSITFTEYLLIKS